jgi:hypothetical protein
MELQRDRDGERPNVRSEQRRKFHNPAADTPSSGFIRRLIRRVRDFLRRLF